MTTDTDGPTDYFSLAKKLRDLQGDVERHREWVIDHNTVPREDLNPTAYYLTNAIKSLDTAIHEASLAAREQEESSDTRGA